MSLEIHVDDSCNIQCRYCYEDLTRLGGNGIASGRPDLDAIKAAVQRAGARSMAQVQADGGRGQAGFTLFGGEPLLMALDDVAELLRWGYEQYGGSTIQTNATLVTDAHIALFLRYGVSIGVSVDGPDELNDARWAGTEARTRDMTAATLRNIAKMLAAGLSVNVIITLHRLNAVGDRLERLKAWLRSLDAAGITSARLHALEIDTDDGASIGLTADEQIAAWRALGAVPLRRMHIVEFDDLRDLLLQTPDAQTSCVYNGCDPYTTAAVTGIDGHGNLGNCGRTNKDGVRWLKAETSGFERYLALYHTPQEHGGCQDCRFFFACKGECPGTAIDADWRNRTRDCAVWMALFADTEQRLVAEGRQPVSLDTARRAAAEAALLSGWTTGQQTANRPHGDIPHGDHTDVGVSRGAGRNGFADETAMTAAHAMVLEALRTHPPEGLVVDLGAGDGTLLLQVSTAFTARVLGVECDRARIPADRAWILGGDLRDAPRLLRGYDVDTLLISANRFTDYPALEETIRPLARQLVVYRYDAPMGVEVR